MLKHRTIALLLAGSITLAMSATILAADPAQTTAAAPSSQVTQTAAPEVSPSPEPVEPEVLPDAEGTLSFTNLAGRMREHELNILTLQEGINALEVIDYKKMEDDLRETLNGIADAQWGMISGIPMGMGSMMASSMQGSYDAVREQFDAVRDGEFQADNAAIIRQLKNTQDLVVMGGESMYLGLLSMEYANGALNRQLTALDRQLQVAELSHQQGNLSDLALKQAQSGRTALVSAMDTLKMNLASLKMQLNSMVGEELTANLLLQSVPQVTAEQITAMDEEADLTAAKAISYELFAAQRTLDDARETFEDDTDGYYSGSKNYKYLAAKHQFQSAQYTYDAAVRSYELKFRTLYLQVKDYWQVWQAAKAALEIEEDNYAVSELKFSQGSISKNALADAADALATAREKVATTGLDLFTSYNNYRWAVDHGILN